MMSVETKPVVPYKDQQSGKKEQVAQMFDAVSHRYDFCNHFLSLGIDKLWRKKAVRILQKHAPKSILDVATGTGDFAIETLRLNPEQVTGVDISNGMLAIGKEKMIKKKCDHIIKLQYGDSENLPFEDNTFDACIVSFGVRNFENLEQGLSEMHRVLKNKGVCVIIEFSQPSKVPFKQFYNFYFKNILPIIGGWFSKDKAAYTYLPDSVAQFPYGEAFVNVLNKIGFKNTTCKPLTFGISSIYVASKE